MTTRKAQGVARVKREVYMLMGGDPNQTTIPPATNGGLKDKRKTPARKWAWKKFTNSARTDGLQLSHWEAATEKPKPYQFAKFNKPIKMFHYTDSEYAEHCEDPGWTREETDYLFALCKRFDLRFFVIADQYNFEGRSRQIEELKERYYTIAQRLLQARSGPDVVLGEHPLFKHAYNKEYDMERRSHIQRVLSRSKEEEQEEARRKLQQEEAQQQKKTSRSVREQSLLEVAMQGKVTDPTSVLTLLAEANIQPRPAKKKKPQPDVDASAVRRLVTSSRFKIIAEMFEGAKAKKIEAIAAEMGFDKWVPAVPTAEVQDEVFALRVEMLLLSKLRHMQTSRADTLDNLHRRRAALQEAQADGGD